MSNDKPNRGSRRSRRRFFRPQKDGTSQPSDLSAQQQAVGAKPPPQRQRKARRKARSRQHASEEARTQLTAEVDVEYVPPKSIFIYTHSAHPEMRDSYEFRPEHFSKVGRRIEDFQIDISSLFVTDVTDADSLPVIKGLSKPNFNWTEWEEE
ncbi:MAG: hypothetical protein ACK4SA_02020 [Caldilinea sp.]